jgi:myo-inositol-1(or 4)-monophosphatase
LSQPDPSYQEALGIARAVASEAATLLRSAGGSVGKVGTKSNSRDLVTEWDTKAEELILRRLHELAPGVPVLAEESGQHGDASSTSRWLVDPIDGTVNFAHGIPLWGICISLEIDGAPVAAVVEAPACDWTFAASLGGGASVNGEPMHVSEVASLGKAMLASGFPYDRATTSHNFPQWEHFQRKAGACRRFGAASLDLCMVARGWLDGYWETRLSPWDLSAGALLVQEAGGIVTGITGEPFSSRSGHAIASNGAIHKEILSELAVVGTPTV